MSAEAWVVLLGLSALFLLVVGVLWAIDLGCAREELRYADQKADDRCWMDDQDLYLRLGDGQAGDNRVGDKAAMLENCARFIERRCLGGHWPTYVELEAAARLGYRLSTWAATIRWDHRDRNNTPEWLDGLRERIEAVQAACQTAKVDR